MFFIGIFGASSAVRPLADRDIFCCPACKKTGLFAQSWKYDYLHAFFLPLLKYHHQVFLTCSNCASLFGVRDEKARELINHPQAPLSPDELILLRSHTNNVCPHCGQTCRPEDRFCSRCGQQL